MKKKTFLQIFFLTAACATVMFACGVAAVAHNSKQILSERLVRETRLACGLLSGESDFNRLSAGGDDLRFTVIDLSGNVLFESATEKEPENHLNREEIINAIKGEPHSVERYSSTLGCAMTYYALKTQLPDGAEVVVRAAVKSSKISDYVIITLPAFVAVLLVSLALSMLFAQIISNGVTNKIGEVKRSLRSLNEGDYEPIKTDSAQPELYSVLNEINMLNRSTHEHIRAEIEERDKLDTVLENVSQGIIAADNDKKIILANKCALEYFGGEGDVKDKDLVYLIDDLALCDLIASHAGEDYDCEYSYKGMQLKVSIKKVESGSDCICSIVIFTDVTLEKQTARQKSEFFANASHELKTPVAVMQGLSELLLAKDLDPASKKQVERIHGESVRLGSLVSDMLELSMMESGESPEVSESEVDLKKTAEEVIGELSHKISRKSISASVTGEGIVRGDPKKIYELVENLCSNAVNYNKENGKIRVEIADVGDKVQLKVIDTGIGIEKQNIPRLCERFYRVDKSRSKQTGGTGLGLAIVKHICALYGATLAIDSEIGLGTAVTVLFCKKVGKKLLS